MTFSQDELISAIRSAKTDEGDTPNSITTRELASTLGIPASRAREQIRTAVLAKKLRPERIWRTVAMTGVRQRVLGYVLVE